MTFPKPLGQDPQDPAVFLASLDVPMLMSEPCLFCSVLQSTWFPLVALLPAADLTAWPLELVGIYRAQQWLTAGFTCPPTEDQ